MIMTCEKKCMYKNQQSIHQKRLMINLRLNLTSHSHVVINSGPTIDGTTLDRAGLQKKKKKKRTSTCDLSPYPREIRANRVVAFNRTRARRTRSPGYSNIRVRRSPIIPAGIDNRAPPIIIQRIALKRNGSAANESGLS